MKSLKTSSPFFPAMWNQNQLEANDLEEELNSILGQKIWSIFFKKYPTHNKRSEKMVSGRNEAYE